MEMDSIVKGLLNGKRPPDLYFSGKASENLAGALSVRIKTGVAPSLCAHAMCGSASVGNVAVVTLLASMPMSTFNKAYNFAEPLRRAIRAYLRKVDNDRREDYRECAKILIAAKADLYHPDKNSPSGMTAARILKEAGTDDARQLLEELSNLQSAGSRTVEAEKKGALKKRKSVEDQAAKAEVKSEVKMEVKTESESPVKAKRARK